MSTSSPLYYKGFITTLLTAYFSDRMRRRGVFIIGWMSVVIIGYTILITQNKPSVSYFAIFLTVAGVSPCQFFPVRCFPLLKPYSLGIATAICWVGNSKDTLMIVEMGLTDVFRLRAYHHPSDHDGRVLYFG